MIDKTFSAAIFITVIVLVTAEPCSIGMCFTWRLKYDHLTLVCKISKLEFQVIIKDPNGSEQAHCWPPVANHHECHSQKWEISQHSDTNETILTIKGNIDHRLNGNWTCLHGRLKDQAKVEVTILELFVSGKQTAESKCSLVLTLWTMLGFSVVFILTRLMIWILNGRSKDDIEVKITKTANKVVMKLSKCCRCILPFRSTSVVVGMIEKEEPCSGREAFLPVGGIIGLLSNVLLFEKEDNSETNIKLEDTAAPLTADNGTEQAAV